jgi:hypothetical protein
MASATVGHCERLCCITLASTTGIYIFDEEKIGYENS